MMTTTTSPHAEIPPDFPRPAYRGAVCGANDKLLLVKYAGDGRFYLPGCTPPEMIARWAACEDLAQQLKTQCLVTKAGKRAHLSEVDILEQYLERLLKTGWRTYAEMRWVARRAAGIIGWPIPESAMHGGDAWPGSAI